MNTLARLLQPSLLGLLLLMVPSTKGFSQESIVADTTQSDMSIQLDVKTFLRNNEYAYPLGTGYTLPGYKLSTTYNYKLHLGSKESTSCLEFQAGLYLLGFMGTQRYPADGWYRELAHWSPGENSSRPFHLKPLISLTYTPNPHIKVTMGSFTPRMAYDLSTALYNPELSLTKDPENGLLVDLNYRKLNADIRVDWHGFIFRNDDRQEAFTASSRIKYTPLLSPRSKLSILAQGVATHRGGEINWQKGDTLHTYAAGGVGVEYHYVPNNSTDFSIGGMYLLSSVRKAEDFYNGKGISLYCTGKYNTLDLRLEYWRGAQFMSPLGGPFVNSLVLTTEGLRMQPSHLTSFISLSPRWYIASSKLFRMYLSGNLWYHLTPTTQNARTSHSIELAMDFSKLFTL